jgi:hypothetical protein
MTLRRVVWRREVIRLRLGVRCALGGPVLSDHVEYWRFYDLAEGWKVQRRLMRAS